MKLKPFLVPDVDIRCSFALLESNFIAVIVRPINSESTTDRTIALENLHRLCSYSKDDGFAVAGSDIEHEYQRAPSAPPT